MADPGPYATATEIYNFLVQIKPTLQLSEITDSLITLATQIINQRADATWDLFIGNLYLDGKNEDWIMCPKIPIQAITALTIISIDGTEESITISGTDKQVEINNETGEIRAFDLTETEKVVRDQDRFWLFPKGLQNIRITGTFGVDAGGSASEILKMLTIMLVMQNLRFKDPESFRQMDLVSETIGEYKWQVGDMQYSSNLKNQKLTLEGYIDYLFNSLPKEDQIKIRDI